MVNYEELLKNVREKIQLLAKGSVFVVKDLFLGVEWDKLTAGEKREFGRRFKYSVCSNEIDSVEYIGRAKNNSAQYKTL